MVPGMTAGDLRPAAATMAGRSGGVSKADAKRTRSMVVSY